jgi:uncharacterized protein (DUF1697 family)
MQPFIEGMEELGFREVESYGMSGNLMFNADDADMGAFESRIEARFDTAAFVRSRRDLRRIVAKDPFGSAIQFLAHPPSAAKRRALLKLDFETQEPVLRGRTVYFVHPARLRGKRTPFDFEEFLGVPGTARSAQVVGKILERMMKGSK